MAAVEVKPDPGYGLRTELAPGALARDQQHGETAAMIGFVAVAVALILLAYYAVRQRRKIARAVDTAVIGGLAAGVRAARSARSRRDGIIRRVLAEADERHPPLD